MNFASALAKKLTSSSAIIDASCGTVIGKGNLSDLIAQTASALLKSGLTQGDRILIGCNLKPESVLTYLGAMYAGLIAVPVDLKLLKEQAGKLLDVTTAAGIWSPTKLSMPYERDFIQLDGFLAQDGVEMLDEAVETGSDEVAALMYTSGSTGEPRFVKLTHGNLLSNTEAIARSQDLAGEDERAMLIMPINYVFGASVLHSHLFVGGSVVLDSRFMFPDKVLRAIDEYNVTSFAGVPSVYNLLLNHSNFEKIEMPGLRRFLQAGGVLPKHSIDRLRSSKPDICLYVMYGQTEATARISCLPPSLLMEKLGSVGLALDNLSVTVIDKSGNELVDGNEGEFFVTGPSISPGYWDEPETKSEVFCNGGLRTGDIGYKDSEKVLWITGRKGDFVKMRGYRVSLSEVESCVHSVEGVDECSVFRTNHQEGGEAVVVIISSHLDVEKHSKLETNVRKALPVHWVCDSIKFVTSIPKNSNGKISRKAVQEMVSELESV